MQFYDHGIRKSGIDCVAFTRECLPSQHSVIKAQARANTTKNRPPVAKITLYLYPPSSPSLFTFQIIGHIFALVCAP
jgi:hypothetical protein